MSQRNLGIITTLTCTILIQACTDTAGPDKAPPHFKVAVSVFDQGATKIIDEAGTLTATITCGQNCRLYHPQWSLSGKTLSMIGYDPNRNSILYVSDETGSNLREITRAAPIPEPSIQGTIRSIPNYYDQAWSADGRLAYVKRDTIFQLPAGATAGSPIAIVAGAHDLTWFAGDTSISLVSGGALKIVNVNSGVTTQLGPFSAGVTLHDPAPDGSAVAIEVRVSDAVRLYVVNLTTNSTSLVATHNQMSSPCWSSDSKAIVFTASNFGDINRLYTFRIQDTQPLESVPQIGPVGYSAMWAQGSRWLLTLASAGFALADLSTRQVTTIPGPGSLNGYAVSTARCGKMFYLLPDGM